MSRRRTAAGEAAEAGTKRQHIEASSSSSSSPPQVPEDVEGDDAVWTFSQAAPEACLLDESVAPQEDPKLKVTIGADEHAQVCQTIYLSLYKQPLCNDHNLRTFFEMLPLPSL